MIKDIVVNLPVGTSRDVTTHFAVTVAAKLGAHLTGIAFLYEPLVPVMVDMYGIPPESMQSQRVASEEVRKGRGGEVQRSRAPCCNFRRSARSRLGRVRCARQVGAYRTAIRLVGGRPAATRTSRRSRGFSSKLHCSNRADPCSSFPTFKRLLCSSIASWCAGTAAAARRAL